MLEVLQRNFTKIFVSLICLLPFGHLMFKGMDIWHGQGHFFQVGLLIIFSCSLFIRPRCVQTVNKPLGLLTLWLGLVTATLWAIIFIKAKEYPFKIFLPFFNYLCFVWFYKLCLEYMDKKAIEQTFKLLRYTVLVLLAYCALQIFNLDEFFNAVGGGRDQLVGTIGNTGHLAGYLALLQPIYFSKKRLNILCLVLLWLIILITGSFSGVFVGIMVALFWLIFTKRYIIASIIGGLGAIGVGLLYRINPDFLSFSNRIVLWKMSWDKFEHKAITGYGLGGFRLSNFYYLSTWAHAHNEYYHFTFEAGVIGLLIICWCIWDYFDTFRTFRTDLTIKIASMFFGFCLLSLFSFPAHLFIVAMLGMISYSFLFVLKNEVTDANPS